MPNSLENKLSRLRTEVLSFVNLLSDNSWIKSNENQLPEVSFHLASRTEQLSLLWNLSKKTRDSTNVFRSASEVLLRRGVVRDALVSAYITHYDRLSESRPKSLEEHFDDVCELYDLFFVGRLLREFNTFHIDTLVEQLQKRLKLLDDLDTQHLERAIFNLRTDNWILPIKTQGYFIDVISLLDQVIPRPKDMLQEAISLLFHEIERKYIPSGLEGELGNEVRTTLRILVETAYVFGERSTNILSMFGNKLLETSLNSAFYPWEVVTPVRTAVIPVNPYGRGGSSPSHILLKALNQISLRDLRVLILFSTPRGIKRAFSNHSSLSLAFTVTSLDGIIVAPLVVCDNKISLYRH